MRYLGIVEKRHSGQIILESYDEKITSEGDDQTAFEAFEIENVIVLVPVPVDRKRLTQIEAHASQSIHDHRTTDPRNFLISSLLGRQQTHRSGCRRCLSASQRLSSHQFRRRRIIFLEYRQGGTIS